MKSIYANTKIFILPLLIWRKILTMCQGKVLWCAMGKLGVEEWLIRTTQVMYTNPKSSVRANGQHNLWFDIQGFCLQHTSIYHSHGSTVM